METSSARKKRLTYLVDSRQHPREKPKTTKRRKGRGEGTPRKRTGSASASSTTSGAGSNDGYEGRQASAEPDAWRPRSQWAVAVLVRGREVHKCVLVSEHVKYFIFLILILIVRAI